MEKLTIVVAGPPDRIVVQILWACFGYAGYDVVEFFRCCKVIFHGYRDFTGAWKERVLSELVFANRI